MQDAARSARELLEQARAVAQQPSPNELGTDLKDQQARLREICRLLNPHRKRVGGPSGEARPLLKDSSLEELLHAITLDAEDSIRLEDSLISMTPFRRAERQFKAPDRSERRFKSDLLQSQFPDLYTVEEAAAAGALDFSAGAACSIATAAAMERFGVISLTGPSSRPSCSAGHSLGVCSGGGVVAVTSHPGVYVLPGVLNRAQQAHWVRTTLRELIERPNRRNIDASSDPDASNTMAALSPAEVLAGIPLSRRHAAAAGRAVTAPSAAPTAPLPPLQGTVAFAEWLWLGHVFRGEGELRKVTWATAGLQYDWTAQCYHVPGDPDFAVHARPHQGDDGSGSRWHAPFPPRLRQLCANIAAAANTAAEGHFAAEGEARRAELGLPLRITAQAGIVNLYQSVAKKLPMGGHIDDMERAYNHPVVSLSLGCACVFLVGGQSKGDTDQPVVPIILRSGDAVLLSGAARLAVHGVARLFEGSAPAGLFAGAEEPPTACAGCSGCCAREGEPPLTSASGAGGERGYYPPSLVDASREEAAFASFFAHSRININVRQVFPDAGYGGVEGETTQ